MADAEIRGQARQKADGDTGVLLAMFRAEKFADNLVKASCAYMSRLHAEERTKSLTDFKSACAEDPIEFEDVQDGGKPGEVPADLLESVVDTPSELLNGCVRAEGGGPKTFSIF